MLKLLGAITAVVFSAIVAGAITGYPGFAEPVSAEAVVTANPVAAPTCPQRGWPYRQCAESTALGKTIRVIPIDRLN